MLCDPLHNGQPGAWPGAGVQAQNNYNFIHPAPSLLASGPNQDRQKTLARFVADLSAGL
jgi:hypothetical protein